MVDFALARLNMVESQIRTNKVTDPAVVHAFETVPRELFVPKAKRGIAYVDEALDIGHGRYMLEPMVLARLLQAAMPGPNDTVLDVGCGTGYAAALLSTMASMVVGLDEVDELVDTGNQVLAELEIDNAALVTGSLVDGYAKHAPYDAILVNGAVDAVPDTLIDQLGDGGRLVTVEGGDAHGPGNAVLYERLSGRIGHRILFDAGTPKLASFIKQSGFVF